MTGTPGTPAGRVIQSAVIPFRRSPGGVEFCLIRWKNMDSWGIPKGRVDRGATQEQAALDEALEEAGLAGRLLGEALGTYAYRKGGKGFIVTVYLMEVTCQRDDWVEAPIRERRWVSLGEARSMLQTHPVWPTFEQAVEKIANASP